MGQKNLRAKYIYFFKHVNMKKGPKDKKKDKGITG